MMENLQEVQAACRHQNFTETLTEQTPMKEKYKSYPDGGENQKPSVKNSQEGNCFLLNACPTGTYTAILEGGGL